jgi:hypothetical protein
LGHPEFLNQCCLPSPPPFSLKLKLLSENFTLSPPQFYFYCHKDKTPLSLCPILCEEPWALQLLLRFNIINWTKKYQIYVSIHKISFYGVAICTWDLLFFTVCVYFLILYN